MSQNNFGQSSQKKIDDKALKDTKGEGEKLSQYFSLQSVEELCEEYILHIYIYVRYILFIIHIMFMSYV